MESARTPNPPVPAVPKAIQKASKTGILPTKIRRRASIAVNPIYIRYVIFAVSFILGTIFPEDGPGYSARMICIVYPPFLPPSETIAIKKTRTPMPPIQ